MGILAPANEGMHCQGGINKLDVDVPSHFLQSLHVLHTPKRHPIMI